MTPARCVQHRAPAGWLCTVCEHPLCPDCAAAQRVGNGTELTLCARCGELAAPLKIARHESRSYLSHLASVPLYPLKHGNLIIVIAVALVFTMLRYYLLFGYLVTVAALWSTLFVLVRRSARGESDFETPEFGNVAEGLIEPVLRGLFATLWWLLPLWFYVAKLHDPARALGSDPVIWLLALLGLLFLPVSLLAAATQMPLLSLLNPFSRLQYVGPMGGDYAWCLVALTPLLAVAAVMPPLALLFDRLPVPLLPKWIAACVELYAVFAAARVLGLLLYVRGEAVGYGAPGDFYEWVLPGAVPRGVVPTKKAVAAIELAPHEGAQDSTAPLEKRSELSLGDIPSAEALFAKMLNDLVKSGDWIGAFDVWRNCPMKPPAGVAARTLLAMGERATAEGEEALAAELLAAAVKPGG